MVSLLGKWITPREISHLYNTGPDFGKLVTVRKVAHTCKNGSYFKKQVTLGKWVTLGNLGHTDTLKSGSRAL